ncbi:hypothetical protein JRQ81_000089 [Phrynocephalus forsythii]|uniref:DDE Tnp4 domain-containing protein n=1 Tax=Phrynocephalus forsythii TaxID=171643 RepID=A0A9Q0Y7D9_9SAUR|nr:hypothetical protein JRQ81_000089 [Phrynocephalus forsythii]
MRSAIPVEERVAIGVYFLASRSCYRTIALVFQKGTSTVASVIVEVCLAIEHTLLKEEVRVSDINKMMSSMRKLGFPHCLGSVDGTHVAITPPKLQGQAYMKPYAVPRNERERHYNKIFNRSRNIVEHALGWLKARFRRLSVRMEAHIQNVNSIIASVVVLHNIFEKKKHLIPNVDQYIEQPTETRNLENIDIVDYNRGPSDRVEAEAIRTAIAEYLFTHVK